MSDKELVPDHISERSYDSEPPVVRLSTEEARVKKSREQASGRTRPPLAR